jgi:N6-L-threonylcarbamoyladenine synthase
MGISVTSSAMMGPVLGIESSCDETAAAVLSADGTVLAQAVLSQEGHKIYGGVVPEIAARAHLKHLPGLVAQVMDEAGQKFADLDAVAATVGPGLIGGLIIGSLYARGLALSAGKKFVAINHLEGHALTPRLPSLGNAPAFPYLLMLLSGGHCQCVAVTGIGQYKKLGGTIDDAVGEAFDKVAKMLGLGWPGGPEVERRAGQGDARKIALPRPLLRREGCDFSFSGLKTAVAQIAAREALTDTRIDDICAGFQEAVAEVMADRARHALKMMPQATRLVVAGGVAANGAIREALEKAAAAQGLMLSAPPAHYCGDNAVMIAWAAIERLRLGRENGTLATPRPRFPLEDLA